MDQISAAFAFLGKAVAIVIGHQHAKHQGMKK